MSKSFSIYRKNLSLKVPEYEPFDKVDLNLLNQFLDNYQIIIDNINNQNINSI